MGFGIRKNWYAATLLQRPTVETTPITLMPQCTNTVILKYHHLTTPLRPKVLKNF